MSAGVEWWSKGDREERLRALWRDGLSASAIARELGGNISRCAVIGKAHRMQLPARGERGKKHDYRRERKIKEAAA